jgi:YD repeat-containing protein
MKSESKFYFRIFILISAVILLSPTMLRGQSFLYRKAITIDHTKVSVTLANFPVLINASNDNNLKSHVTNPNGYDLVFTDTGGTQLDHELERWDGLTGTLIAWVRIPSLSSTTDTVIYMYYGSSGVTTSQENRAGVWDSNFKGVWHLKEATGANAADSTSNGNTGTPRNSPAQMIGEITGSLNFNGTTQYLTTPITTVYQQFTLSAWIKPLSSGRSSPFLVNKISYYAVAVNDWPISFYGATNGTSATIQISPGIDYSTCMRATSPTFMADQWHHVAATYDGTTLRAYADGAYNQTTASYTLPSNSLPWTIGRAALEAGGGVGNSFYSGSIDEVRISKVARSPDWILAEYRNQSSPLTFHSVGGEGLGGSINHSPLAQNQNVSTNTGTAKTIILAATDADNEPLTYQIVTQPSHGTLSGTPPNVTYTPAASYSGSDTFTFKANDGKVDGNVASVSISVIGQIGCGQTLSGSISAAGQKKSYTFSASANDGITFRARKTSGNLTPYIQLYSPGGALITGAANQIDRILTETGIYRIDVGDQNNANTGDYLLYWQRMNIPCNATPINCGQVVTGSIGTSADPPPWRVYTFTGAVNDVLTIRTGNLSPGSFTPNIELYSPSGSLLVSNYNQVDRTLTVAGTYTILMRAYSAGTTGNFTLTWQKMNAPCSLSQITCGQVLSGSISTAGESDIYSFTVSANDVVTIRVMKTSGTLYPNVELFNAAGSRIVGPTTQIDTTFATAGTYTILLRDYNTTGTGNYLLYWQKVKNPCNVLANLSCGQVVTGSIGTSVDPPPWRVYAFTGAVNDVLTIRMGNLSPGSFTPNIELYSPSGSLLVSNYNQLDRTLTVAGTYTILMRAYSAGTTGNFTLTWQKMNAPCNLTPITCGQVLSGSISTAGELDIYSFTVSANDVVTIRRTKTSGSLNPYLELFNAAGSRIAGPTTQIDMTFATAGTYTILVRDYNTAATGNYLLSWQRFNSPCAPAISCGLAATGSIGTTTGAPPWAFYRLTASANDIVKIRAVKTSGSLVPYLDLYSFNGSLVTNAAGEINTTLSVGGTYTIVVRDQSNTYTGGYAVTWQKWNNPCASAINCGQVVSGSIGITANPPPWKYYSLAASANDSVTVRVTKTSGTLTPYLELYGPSGTLIGSGTGQLDRTLVAAGAYTIMVRDQNSLNTGNFILTWHRINNPCNTKTIGCGQVLQGTLSAVGKIGVFTFNATGGDNVVLTLTRTSGGLDPSLELYNSSGSRLAYQNTPSGNQVIITQTLSTGGTYAVFASDYGNDETGNYSLKFQKNNNSCSEVTVTSPNGGERIVARSNNTIRWTCTSSQGITSQEIRLSKDGGVSFPNVIATALQGDVRSYNWAVPPEMVTTQGQIRLTVTDGLGRNTSDDSDANFEIYQGVGRTYIYDELNRLIQVIYEDGRRVTYTYDAVGNRITVTND